MITIQIYLSSETFKNNNNLEIIEKIFEENIFMSTIKKNKQLFFSCLGGIFRYYHFNATKYKHITKTIYNNYDYESFLIAYPNIIENHLLY